MADNSGKDLIKGWVSSPNVRGTTVILYNSLSTIYLCTWTSLCLNIPQSGTLNWRFIIYKFRWHLFAIFFPEVLVATAAEQWLSARQSVQEFTALGYPGWTMRHGFYADMGGIKIAPPDIEPFPVDSQQLAYLVRHKYMPMPQISTNNIRGSNKADGFARGITLIQMTWFCLYCIGRAVTNIGLAPLELTTLCFIFCTMHNYFFWFFKPMDPARGEVFSIEVPITQICGSRLYKRTPLDFVKSAPDSKSLVTPFWFGFGVLFDFKEHSRPKPMQSFANSGVIPQNGIGWGLTLYMLLFQAMYYGLHLAVGWTIDFPSQVEWYLWTTSGFADMGLIAIYCMALPLGTYFAPFIGRVVFHTDASSILEVAEMLPKWAKLLIHAPFVLAYIAARALVLVESIISLRALSSVLYIDVDWSSLIPHL
jgi:hypothetical protein